jgi:dTDP-4-dehydrorhamnose reductase
VSPTYIVDLVNVSLDLLIDGEEGIWHLANAGEISWKALAQRYQRTRQYYAFTR